ncbi:MAG: L-threonylcarbamoyladenylate synthase [Kiritimatiellae bacterium]|nr:L-threonylcarbamoyladenylate synthase [Kiritimatiellia bacterium]MDD5520037.1 L-threonylcarbamoyladenylate synthase [Kiritimatiellia bacterium]
MGTKQPLILQVRQRSAERNDSINRAAGVLRGGSLVIVPTDTVYGVAADARIKDAEEKIYRAKGRERGKPIPILAADIGQVEKYGVEFDRIERKLAEKFWPGALTLVLMTSAGTEGFRVPDYDVALELLRAAGGVLRVTSANVSGEPPALTADEAINVIGGSVELVLDAGRVPGGIPSTVAKVENGRVIVLREGAISADELTACIKQ